MRAMTGFERQVPDLMHNTTAWLLHWNSTPRLFDPNGEGKLILAPLQRRGSHQGNVGSVAAYRLSANLSKMNRADLRPNGSMRS